MSETEYCFIHVCKNDKYKIESQVTSPKLTIAMAAQLLYCCRRSGEKFLSETPVNNKSALWFKILKTFDLKLKIEH